MTDFNMQAIECPICKTEQTTKIWECVDVTANEKRKEKLLADEIFVFKCAKCGHTVPLVYNCLYVDDDARLMIWMLPEATEKELAEMSEQMNAIKKKDENGKPYTLRVVSNPNELKEKVIIKDAGLDDCMAELMKMVYLSQIPAITGDEKLAEEGISEMYLNLTEDGGYCFTIFFESDRELIIGADREVYDKLVDDFGKLVEENMDEGFARIDFEWAKNMFVLKNEEQAKSQKVEEKGSEQ